MLIVDKEKQEAIKITDCKIKVISGKKKIKKEIKKHRKRMQRNYGMREKKHLKEQERKNAERGK